MSDDMIETVKTTLDNIRNIQAYKNSRGKFEGESIATNYYYDLSLDGGQTVFEIQPEERILFGFWRDANYLVVEEDDNGFVTVILFTNEAEAEEYAHPSNEDEFEDN